MPNLWTSVEISCKVWLWRFFFSSAALSFLRDVKRRPRFESLTEIEFLPDLNYYLIQQKTVAHFYEKLLEDEPWFYKKMSSSLRQETSLRIDVQLVHGAIHFNNLTTNWQEFSQFNLWFKKLVSWFQIKNSN